MTKQSFWLLFCLKNQNGKNNNKTKILTKQFFDVIVFLEKYGEEKI